MTLNAFVITLLDNEDSVASANACITSIQQTNSALSTEIVSAITPNTMFECKWTWPLRKKHICPITGLLLSAYKNADINKRIACAQSHYMLWKKCIELNEPIMILEHDALFVKKFSYNDFDGGAMSINSPINATFNSKEYDAALIDGINEVPYVTDVSTPQGLPGHSAYVIKPWAAEEIINKQDEIGWWPNDAIMCRQLFPWLRVCKPYYTVVQNTKSSTVN
jgi:hypothetical protein